jgi:hypothetical protein
MFFASGSDNRMSTQARKLSTKVEVEAPLVTRDVEASFCQGYYSPSTNLDRSEWEVMYLQFIESGLVVKSELVSD